MDLTASIQAYIILSLVHLYTCFVPHRGGFHFPLMQVVEENHNAICGRHEYLSKNYCSPCSMCPPGYGVRRRCSTWKDTVCEPCREGRSYSPYTSLWARCRPCTKCKHREHSQDCSTSTNTVCGACEKGYYYWPEHKQCYKCSYCHPELPGATYQVPECDVPGQRPDNQCVQLKHVAAQRAPPMMRMPFF